jgi:hypothetical protein
MTTKYHDFLFFILRREGVVYIFLLPVTVIFFMDRVSLLKHSFVCFLLKWTQVPFPVAPQNFLLEAIQALRFTTGN